MLPQPSHFKSLLSDRFLLNRQSTHYQYQQYLSNSQYNHEKPFNYKQFIAQSLFNHHNLHSHILHSFNNKSTHHQKQTQRVINTAPQKILDAPQLKDDYYLNLLDWSVTGILSIGLANRVYLYSSTKITQLCQQNAQYICSLSFNPNGSTLAVGLSNGKIQLYDPQTQTLIRTLKGHNGRVSSSAFTYSNLYTGSRDSLIIAHDPRAHHHISMKMEGHRGQVCGLKHDSCGLASGSNDNLAIIWDLNMGKQRFQLSGHKAAVKALAWCPWQRNLLATGGGSSDKTMRFWNIENGKNINIVNTESQVCSLIWNKNDKQILSSHGYSENQLCVWKYPQCTKIGQMRGHTQRVLHMTLSPDNSTVCSASADQTLRFWKVFEESSSFLAQQKYNGKLNPKNLFIR